jgi:response regulator RpfG family c-di-GMP phosphodiesterase
VQADSPDLILMDIVLKGKMDGIEAADRINSQFNIPMIYLTAYTNPEYIERAKQTKPFSYLVKPFNQKELHANIEMALHRHVTDKEIKDRLDRLTRSCTGMMKAFSGTVELRKRHTPLGHHQRVAFIAHGIAKEMGLSDFSAEGLWLAAHDYDISFVNMPIKILMGASQLAGHNMTQYRKYPRLSYEILEPIDFPWPIADIALQHRECFDGSGYPQGIKGEDILIEARILAVAVAIEDFTAHRIFRKAFPLKQAFDKISAHRGSQYDPNVVDACLRLFNEKGYKTEG